jgi:hypothetical protein
MRYESAVNSAGGDDVALAKSFIFSCEGPVLNWYSLLPLLWGKPQLSHTNNERRQKLPKTKMLNEGQTKASFSTEDFSKADPLYKCRSVSFYREAGGLFTFREHPRVK